MRYYKSCRNISDAFLDKARLILRSSMQIANLCEVEETRQRNVTFARDDDKLERRRRTIDDVSPLAHFVAFY